MICFRCKQFFVSEHNDDRPFLFHRCTDGVLAGNVNPVFWDRSRKYPVSIEGNYRHRTWCRNLGSGES